MAQTIGDRHNKCHFSTCLGAIYYSTENEWDLIEAIKYYRQALAVASEMGDRKRERDILSIMGTIYLDIGPIENYVKRLFAAAEREFVNVLPGEIVQSIRVGEAGPDHEVELAIEYSERSLAIARDIGDRRNLGNTLNNLATA